MSNYPHRFGFIGDLRECVGKTIEHVELLRTKTRTGFAWAIRFTDGSRAFIFGHANRQTMYSALNYETIEQSALFTPEEVGILATDLKREREAKAKRRREEKVRKYERLQRELGFDGDEEKEK